VDLEVASSRSEVVKRIARYVYSGHHTHRMVAGNDRRLAALPWRDGGALVRFGAATPEDPVSISYARFGVAETGSLVLYCSRDNPAANNWLPRDHIVILDGNDLVSHLEHAWAGIRAERGFKRMPRGVTFISGPSSTGDIVGHMVTGAHGPQRLHLIYLGAVPDELLERTGHASRDRL
jgi:L-lactate dehydrogenase complex protein LldG